MNFSKFLRTPFLQNTSGNLFCNESTYQFDSSFGVSTPPPHTKSKYCCNDPVFLQGTFILKSPQALLISTVRSLDNLVVIKTQIVVPQNLKVSDFRGVKYNDAETNTYQFVGSINFEGSSTNTAKNSVISPNFLVWKFCGKTQFLHGFGRIARNYAETVPFHKISIPES